MNLEEIKLRLPLSVVVGQHIILKPKNGELWGLCPFHDEKTPSFSVNDTKAGFYCFGCGAKGDVFDFIQRIEGIDFKSAKELLSGDDGCGKCEPRPENARLSPAAPAEKNREKALKIWQETDQAQGTLAETYLRSRGIIIPTPPTLRFHQNLKHYSTGLEFPAMVAAVSDENHKVAAIQRIYLRANGRGKANINPNKMALGGIRGRATRLSPLNETLVLTEGVEDGLSILQARPEFTVWATLGTQNLASQTIPSVVKHLIIGADNDPAGQGAAKEAAKQYAKQGLKVTIATPQGDAKDFNDVLTKKGKVA